ncbi:MULTISPECIES: RNA deprotection pyrophosphohydrolase [Exiguobacterium]|uniref:NAD-capped RNA decapping enzyme nucleoside and RNA triphosphate phosphohydrolase n=1 Tax=Exiguobacterium oxidotolerans TaxID=223958 RepID=A0A653IAY2_9BACL|nr:MULTISPECIES: nucleoside triphosphatase YtkD [Exiguobacterium]ASI36128.1 nucleoside triphosphatase YtkD [Exiguobacterium sp. N4-1P]VWX36193.1 NAD-capped RNA decapping enzyme; nucleoside and RNA triphosphate phosphohydrolase [Exiguobacterium oxidotolerans]
MIRFLDYYQNQVELSFDDHPFSTKPLHVWVIAVYEGKWLLTHHKQRGYEFPGGKVEPGETAEEAARREVMEETGGSIASLAYIGQYRVEGRGDTIIKNIYFAEIESLVPHLAVDETDGAFLLDDLPQRLDANRKYSFMMKDRVLPETLRVLAERRLV